MVIHILKDGTRVDDICGHIVKMNDAKSLYNFISKLKAVRNDEQK